MRLDQFIANEIDAAQENILKWKAYKKMEGKNIEKRLKFELDSKITVAKDRIARLKQLKKVKLVRLVSGKVISLSLLEAFQKKLKRVQITGLQQFEDGLLLTYKAVSGEGKITIHGFGVDLLIPEEVVLPVYTEGEVFETCLKSSESSPNYF